MIPLSIISKYYLYPKVYSECANTIISQFHEEICSLSLQEIEVISFTLLIIVLKSVLRTSNGLFGLMFFLLCRFPLSILGLWTLTID